MRQAKEALLNKTINSKQECLEKILGYMRMQGAHTTMMWIETLVGGFLDNLSAKEIAAYTPAIWSKKFSSIFEHIESIGDSSAPLIKFLDAENEGDFPGLHTGLVIQTAHAPFVVDSLSAYLTHHMYSIHNFLYSICAIKGATKDTIVLYVELQEWLDTQEQEIVKKGLQEVLEQVRLSVEDWPLMRQVAQKSILGLDGARIDSQAKKEIQDFLNWINQDNFTFLGYRLYSTEKSVPHFSKKLGILKGKEQNFFSQTLTEDTTLFSDIFTNNRSFFSISKTMVKSKVHRVVPMDVVRVPHFDEVGHYVGEHQFFGLFTSSAYTQSIQTIPLLRAKAVEILQKAETTFPVQGQGSKALLHILESFPRDELFQADTQYLYETVEQIFSLSRKQRAVLFVRPDSLGHFYSCLVYIPRDAYSASRRKKISAVIADCLQGSVASFHTEIGGDLSFARIHIIVATTGFGQNKIMCDLKSVEQLLDQYTLSWSDRVREFLAAKEGYSRAKQKVLLFEDSFPEAYKDKFPLAQVAEDMTCLQKVWNTQLMQVQVYETARGEKQILNFKFFNSEKALALSDILPFLEDFGLYILTEAAYCLPAKDSMVWMHHFTAEVQFGGGVDLDALRPNLIKTLQAVWAQDVEKDILHTLIIRENISCRDVVLIRAYLKYMIQLGIVSGVGQMVHCLQHYSGIFKLLVGLFYAQFDLEHIGASEEEFLKSIQKNLHHVRSAADENILQKFLSLIRATVRTNYFQKDEKGEHKPYISFKIEGDLLPNVDAIRPKYEIFVYAKDMEGIHLRGGKVARGGIRWSDRMEDYRKEVFDLMKSQMVKNAVIVPLGAKGGFIVKRNLEGLSYQEKQQAAIACYKIFIRGMLDITDNLVHGEIAPPMQVKRRDVDDPYLVVAADKGTASFSDVANALSSTYGFWMGDAFASGGSAGYDHKKIGITSRGAWESVKRHFKEASIDINKPFSVIGVGDMSGDVFGNGMLFSDKIKLVAAFNHAHIFIDPHPDAQASFAERNRLFNLPGSGWGDYNSKMISAGGGVFDRSAKLLSISTQIQKLLGLEDTKVSPDALIRAILQLSVDLCWLGGIGTFVKSDSESTADAADKINDAIRLNASQLRCKVIAEGANLGITQKGRVEYALCGGKINRDSIDNSAGVNCSDHEVNLKILFQEPIRKKKISLEKRDAFLKKVTEEVTNSILKDNDLQVQAISVVEACGSSVLARQKKFMHTLENMGIMHRDVEFLPSDQMLQERVRKGQGLTRPEIAVLVSYGKIFAYDILIASALPDTVYLQKTLRSYFPQLMQEQFKADIRVHPLRREIIATLEANNLVNRMGPAFLTEAMAITGCSPHDIIQAYIFVREAYDMESHWVILEKAADVSYANMLYLQAFIEKVTLWLLKAVSVSDIVFDGIKKFQEILKTLKESYMEKNEFISSQLNILQYAPFIFGIVQKMHADIQQTVKIFCTIEQRLSLLRAEGLMARIVMEDRWDKKALHLLAWEVRTIHTDVTCSWLKATQHDKTFSFKDWESVHKKALQEFDAFMHGLKGQELIHLPQAFILVQHLRELLCQE